MAGIKTAADLEAKTLSWGAMKEYKKAIAKITAKNSQIKDAYDKLQPGDDPGELLVKIFVAGDEYDEVALRLGYGLSQEDIDGMSHLELSKAVEAFLAANERPVEPVVEGDGGKKAPTLRQRVISLGK